MKWDERGAIEARLREWTTDAVERGPATAAWAARMLARPHVVILSDQDLPLIWFGG